MEGKMGAHARKTKNRKKLWTEEMNGLLAEKLLKALFSTSSFPICNQRKKLLTKSQKKILNISLHMCKQQDRESSPSPSVCKDTQEQSHSSALPVTSGVLQQDTSIHCDASCSSKLALLSYTCVINRCYMHLPETLVFCKSLHLQHHVFLSTPLCLTRLQGGTSPTGTHLTQNQRKDGEEGPSWPLHTPMTSRTQTVAQVFLPTGNRERKGNLHAKAGST